MTMYSEAVEIITSRSDNVKYLFNRSMRLHSSSGQHLRHGN